MPAEPDFAARTDPHRRELLAHCYRMLGSFQDAEDAVQETYLRAWRAFDRFEGRSSVRTWLYRIATRVCLTAAESRDRRVLPSGLTGANTDGSSPVDARRPEVPWLEPIPDDAIDGDPAAVLSRRERTRLAFVAALQQLPARQRAALLLRDVVAMPAAEVAELLDLTPAAVNSALQRARAHVEHGPREEEVVMSDLDEVTLRNYITAFERSDVHALAALLRHDVALEMPPIPTWFSGRDAVVEFFGSRVLALEIPRRAIAVRANGCPAVASYGPDEAGRMMAHSIQVLEMVEGRIVHIYAFLDTDLFASFGLPPALSVVS